MNKLIQNYRSRDITATAVQQERWRVSKNSHHRPRARLDIGTIDSHIKKAKWHGKWKNLYVCPVIKSK